MKMQILPTTIEMEKSKRATYESLQVVDNWTSNEKTKVFVLIMLSKWNYG